MILKEEFIDPKRWKLLDGSGTNDAACHHKVVRESIDHARCWLYKGAVIFEDHGLDGAESAEGALFELNKWATRGTSFGMNNDGMRLTSVNGLLPLLDILHNSGLVTSNKKCITKICHRRDEWNLA